MLVAQAMVEGLTLVTSDPAVANYPADPVSACARLARSTLGLMARTFRYRAASRSRSAAASGVRSRCGEPSISKPTMNFLIVAERSSGG